MSPGGRYCLALALLSGCLTAPPDDAKPGDAATSCTTIVKDDFLNEERWYGFGEDSGVIALFADRVEISIPDAGYVELTTVDARPIEGTMVEATLVVDQSDAGDVSIAFDGMDSGGGYYEIRVNYGSVESRRADGGGNLFNLCGAACPEYLPDVHQRFRLWARQDRVYYESYDGQGWTQLVPSETGSPVDFTVSLKASGYAGNGQVDAVLTKLSWLDCLQL